MTVRISVQSLTRRTGMTVEQLDKCCHHVSSPAKDYYMVCAYHEGFDDGWDAAVAAMAVNDPAT